MDQTKPLVGDKNEAIVRRIMSIKNKQYQSQMQSKDKNQGPGGGGGMLGTIAETV